MVKKDTMTVSLAMQEIRDFVNLLEPEQAEELRANLTLQSYKKNTVVYDYGDVPQYMYCLLRGKAKVVRQGIGKRPQIVRAMKPVDYFGYRAFFARENYRTVGATLEDSVICLIPMPLIEHWMQTNIALSNFFVHILSVYLGYSDQRLVTLTQKHIRGRLADSLLFLHQNYGFKENSCCLNVGLSREDLASLSNMTTSNAIRTLRSFADEGLIEIDGRHIFLLNIKTLENISKSGE